ncbi:MAG: hypothetical protein AAFN92_08115, partial [Bacteroidota bacterium]
MDFENLVPSATFDAMVNLVNSMPAGDYTFELEVSAPDGLKDTPSTGGSSKCPLEVDCANITDETLSCRADLPPVDFTLPIIVVSCDDPIQSALTIIPGNSGCPGDEVSITRTYFIQDPDDGTGTGTAGLTLECGQTFTVVSNVGPTITCPADADLQCGEVPTVNAADATATAECGTPAVSVSGPVQVGEDNVAGTTYTFTYTVTDFCGRTASCDQVFTVVDNTAPELTCQDVEIFLDDAGMASAAIADIVVSATDNCDSDLVGPFFVPNMGANEFTCDDAGMTFERMLEVGDASGNRDTCTFNVLVTDATAPVLVCQDVEVFLDENGEASAEIDDIVVSETDNCDMDPTGAFFVPNMGANEFSCDDAEQTLVRMLEIGDMAGNRDTCTFNVTVRDTTPPTVDGVDATIELDIDGNAFLSIADVVDLGTFGDNCSIADILIAPGSDQDAVFECDQVGDNDFTFIVVDPSGNETTVTVTVTVEDNLPPGIIDLTQGILNGSFESGSFTGWTVEDNPAPFRPWTVNDGTSSGSGFFADAFPTDGGFLAFNGFDGGAGLASLSQEITLPLDYEGELSWDENIDYDLASFSGPDAMTRIHQVQVRDADGKVLEVLHEVMAMNGMIDNDNEWISYSADLTAYAGQTITLAFAQIIPDDFSGPAKFAVDNIDLGPFFSVDVTLDGDGMVSLDVDELAAAEDNCGVASLEVMPMDLDCENIGPNTVTVVATDVNGNESTLEIPVNVDFVQPNLACIGDLNLTLNDNCQGLLVPSMLLRGDIECIDVFGFEIVVNDDNPDNGPIVDGCGRFSYTIVSTESPEETIDGFTGIFAPENFDLDTDGAADGSLTAAFNGDE